MKKKIGSLNSYFILGLIAVVTTIVLVVSGWTTVFRTAPDATFQGLPYDRPELASEFILTDHNHNTVKLSDFQGKVVMLYFGFTNCPDVCPITFGVWSQVAVGLGDRVDDVQFLFISVDPERDTPEQIARYLSLFSADIVGLTGTIGEIEDVATDYSVFFEQVESDSSDYYWLNHTALSFVIDREGQLVLAFPYGTRADDILADLEQLLG